MNKFVINAIFSLLQFIIQEGNSSFSNLRCYDEEMSYAIPDTNDCLEFSLTQWLIPTSDSVPQTQWEAKKNLLAENNQFILLNYLLPKIRKNYPKSTGGKNN